MINYGNIYKYLDQTNHGFWNPKKLLTYQRPINIVTGSRSIGKSTGIAVLCLLDWLQNQHKFMYVRRRQRDTYKTCKTFFENAVTIVNQSTYFHIKAFKFYNGKYYIATKLKEGEEGEPDYIECGMASPLSSEEELKSSVFSDYNTIIYDEFISKDPNKYLGTRDNPDFEYDSLTSLYQTVDRGVNKPFRDETSVFLLANKSTIYNPICLSLNVVNYLSPHARFTAPKNECWVWENIDHVEAANDYKDSFAYKISSASVKQYAYENTGSDNVAFIKKPSSSTVYVATIKFKGISYGVRRDFEFCYYIGKPQTGYAVRSLDIDSHDGNDLALILNWRECPLMCSLTEAFKLGRLYFDNGKIKNAILKYLQFMP